MRSSFIIFAVALTFASGYFTQLSAQEISKYAGEEKREIRTLSSDDIEQLEQGRGWGLAKAAELNGYPGPVHVLELKDRLELTAVQEAKVQSIFEDMKRSAVPLGLELIGLEKQLNLLFASGGAESEKLRSLLGQIGDVTAKLRFVHLAAHLGTRSALTAEQVKRYDSLRGYAGDPCKNIPEGHDPEMWKKHNGCASQ